MTAIQPTNNKKDKKEIRKFKESITSSQQTSPYVEDEGEREKKC